MSEQRLTQSPEKAKQRNARRESRPDSVPSLQGGLHPLLQLQRTIGNRAVNRLLQSRTLQAKLTVSQPHDPYEQEADRVAEQVMRMPDPTIQRTCAPCAAGGPPCPKCADEKKPTVQRKADLPAAPAQQGVPDDFVRDLGPGQPLDSATRAFFEPRFGHDFSQVRVHSDATAEQSAREVNALAYTVGRDVAFGAGQYAPQTGAGRKLLAHELTHVVQQRDMGSKMVAAPIGDLTHSMAPIVQRRLAVNPAASVPLPAGTAGPPTPLTIAVQGLLATTCPDGNFQVDGTTGNVTSPLTKFCEQPPPPIPYLAADVSSTPAGCGCLCDVISSAQTTTIDFRAGGPSTDIPPGGAGFGGVAASTSVRVDPRFQGQYRINGRWVDVPFHLLLAHEVCGHALPIMRGTHAAIGPGPAGGTPPHERRAVDVEREIAAEGGQPRRPEDYSGAARQRP